MQFSILERRKIDIPATVVEQLATAVREKWERPKHEPVAVEDILNEAAARGLVELPDSFTVDDSEELHVTNEEILEFIEDETAA